MNLIIETPGEALLIKSGLNRQMKFYEEEIKTQKVDWVRRSHKRELATCKEIVKKLADGFPNYYALQV